MKNRKMRLFNSEEKIHRVKTYKDGKKWVAMGITALAIGTGAFVTNANAATVSTADNTPQSSTQTTKAATASDSKTQVLSQTDTARTTATTQTNKVTQSTDSTAPSTPVAGQNVQKTQPTSVAKQPVSEAKTIPTDKNIVTEKAPQTDAQFKNAQVVAKTEYEKAGIPQKLTRVDDTGIGSINVEYVDDTGNAIKNASVVKYANGKSTISPVASQVSYSGSLETLYNGGHAPSQILVGADKVHYSILDGMSNSGFKNGVLMGIYSDTPITIKVAYARMVPVVQRLVDESGRELQSSQTIYFGVGTPGHEYFDSVHASTLVGYTLVDPNRSTITFPIRNTPLLLIANFVYRPLGTVAEDGLGTTNITVKYVDQNGQSIQNSNDYTKNQGINFGITAPVIPGYELANPTQTVTNGTAYGNQMTLTLTYKQVDTGTGPINSNPINNNPVKTTTAYDTTTPDTNQTVSPTSSTPTSAEPVMQTSEGTATSAEPDTRTQGTTISTQPDTVKSGQSTAAKKGQAVQNASVVTAQSAAGRAIVTKVASQNINVQSTKAQSTKTQTLPQTSESASASLIALLGMSILGALGIDVKKRKHEN
ncbi:MucBP domain-containing protein [Secundilactobacillus hailunensis]|uniref:MucBP domain-containing protein n=1 Tax=Secundilactobacillus hailunensis TaxID=2559923 RepID=A0ABW1T7D9_9LACO|nr:MucBP domain-containing protein [Secundilactobacillus hailunensis]